MWRSADRGARSLRAALRRRRRRRCVAPAACRADAAGRVRSRRVEVVGTAPLPGLGHAARAGSRQRADASARATSIAQRTGGVAEFLEPERQQRRRSTRRPATVPARRELSRLHGVAAARHAAGAVRLPGRRAHQRSVRRRRQLGPAAEERRRVDAAPAGLESGVRAEHAGRRADDPHEGRLPLRRAPARRVSAGSFGRAELAADAGGNHGDARRRSPRSKASTTTAGATIRRRASAASTRASTAARRARRRQRRRDARRQPSRRHAGAARVDARQSAAGLHVARHDRQPARVRQRQRQHALRRRTRCVAANAYYRQLRTERRQQQRQRRLRAAGRAVRSVQRRLERDDARVGRVGAGARCGATWAATAPSDRRRRRARCRHDRLRRRARSRRPSSTDRDTVGIGAVRAADRRDDDEPLRGRLRRRHDRARTRMDARRCRGATTRRAITTRTAAATRRRSTGRTRFGRFNPAPA